MPKLYELPKGAKIQVDTDDGKVFVIFDHIDGMYSYCYLETDPTKLLHLSASTPLKKVDDYYEIA